MVTAVPEIIRLNWKIVYVCAACVQMCTNSFGSTFSIAGLDHHEY